MLFTSFKISLKDTSIHVSLNSLGFISFQNFCWIFSNLYIPSYVEKIFTFYGIHIPTKCIESIHFYSCPSSWLKTLGKIFINLFLQRKKVWRKLWFAFSKFNQKIWRWLGALGYSYCMICNFSKCDGLTV